MITIPMKSAIAAEKISVHILQVKTAPASAIRAALPDSFTKSFVSSGNCSGSIKSALAVRHTIDHATNPTHSAREHNAFGLYFLKQKTPAKEEFLSGQNLFV